MSNQDNKKITKTESEINEFIVNLERASSTVKAWPQWKQNAWGPAISSENIGCFINNK